MCSSDLTRVSYEFPVFRIYEGDEEALKASDNPFDLAHLAGLRAWKSHGSEARKLDYLKEMLGLLDARGWSHAIGYWRKSPDGEICKLRLVKKQKVKEYDETRSEIMEHLFATWRMTYIAAPKHEGCIFCDFPAEHRDAERYILHPH